MTFTKEQLQHIIETDHVQCGDASALARMALAGMEAEPVAWAHRLINKRNGVVHPWVYGSAEACPSEGDIFNIEVMPLYTAPPAPVSVPAAMEMDDDFDSSFEHGKAVGWNAYRAAMLQGADRPQNEPQNIPENIPVNTPCKEAPEHIWLQTAGVWPENGEFSELTWCSDNQHEDDTLYVRADVVTGNSPVIPDGWVACSERMPESDDFVYIWPRPDFGVELHVAQHGKFDKRDAGWYAQVYEQNYGIEYYPIKVTHWMPLPAAPQQEA